MEEGRRDPALKPRLAMFRGGHSIGGTGVDGLDPRGYAEARIAVAHTVHEKCAAFARCDKAGGGDRHILKRKIRRGE